MINNDGGKLSRPNQSNEPSEWRTWKWKVEEEGEEEEEEEEDEKEEKCALSRKSSKGYCPWSEEVYGGTRENGEGRKKRPEQV